MRCAKTTSEKTTTAVVSSAVDGWRCPVTRKMAVNHLEWKAAEVAAYGRNSTRKASFGRSRPVVEGRSKVEEDRGHQSADI